MAKRSLSPRESTAGLKKGAVEGLATATPTPPIAIDLGSKPLCAESDGRKQTRLIEVARTTQVTLPIPEI